MNPIDLGIERDPSDQEKADLMATMLALDNLRQEGLVDLGRGIDRAKCQGMLSELCERGVRPSPDAYETMIPLAVENGWVCGSPAELLAMVREAERG